MNLLADKFLTNFTRQLFGLNTPVTACSNCDDFAIYIRMFQVVLLKSYSALFLVDSCLDPAHPELNV
jgi:hypothetical protein